jgi:hypothetical protein
MKRRMYRVVHGCLRRRVRASAGDRSSGTAGIDCTRARVGTRRRRRHSGYGGGHALRRRSHKLRDTRFERRDLIAQLTLAVLRIEPSV